MALRDTIMNDLKTAMKAHEAQKVETLRMLMAAFKNKEIEKRGKGEASDLTDDELREVTGKEVKRRREAAEIFATAKREDLALKERAEIEILSRYLPAQMSRTEIESAIDRIIKGGAADFSTAMKEAMKELKGKADGKVVGEIIKRKLS